MKVSTKDDLVNAPKKNGPTDRVFTAGQSCFILGHKSLVTCSRMFQYQDLVDVFGIWSCESCGISGGGFDFRLHKARDLDRVVAWR